jgi:hypothetical protein
LYLRTRLPGDWDGAGIDVVLSWFPGSGGGGTNVRWLLSVLCHPEGSSAVNPGAFNGPEVRLADAAGKPLQWITTAFTNVPKGLCAPNHLLSLLIQRDGPHTEDTYTSAADLVGVTVRCKRTLTLE